LLLQSPFAFDSFIFVANSLFGFLFLLPVRPYVTSLLFDGGDPKQRKKSKKPRPILGEKDDAGPVAVAERFLAAASDDVHPCR
jgi:hypothetical protein